MALPFLPTGGDRERINPTFKLRTTLDQMSNFEIRKHCAMDIINVRELLELLAPALDHVTNRGHVARPETQLISAMSFFRSGSFQYVEGTVGGTSQSTVSRVIERISTYVCLNMNENWIRFPSSVSELNSVKQAFFDISGVPNIGGVIDGSHVGIKSPSDNESAFVNRKGIHAINCQLVCAPNNSFTDAVVKWPGSTHDSFMWNNSGLKQRFDTGEFRETWLIGN